MNNVQEIPFAKLRPSPLNPRKDFDAQKIERLAISIDADGVLQNLTARPDPKNKGAFEIIAGACRWQAFERLVKTGKRKPEDGLPVQIKDPCSDRELVELAMIENLQRTDLHPLDEAEGFAKLRELGMKTDEMERLVPYTLRHIQLRLQLHDNLSPATKKGFRAEAFSLSMARVIAALCPDPKRQAKVVKMIGERYNHGYGSPSQLTETLRRESVPLSRAIFKREAYTGKVIVDDGMDDPDHVTVKPTKPVELAADVEQFRKLQLEAAEARRAKLAKTWSEAFLKEVTSNLWSPYYDNWEDGCKDKKKASAVVAVYPDGRVKTFTGLVMRDLRRSNGAAAGPKATPEQKAAAKAKAEAAGETAIPSKAGQVIAKHAKTRALRKALLEKGHHHAMIIACIGLITMGDTVALDHRHGNRNDDAIAAPEVEAVFGKFWPRLSKFVGRHNHIKPGDRRRLYIGYSDEGKAASLFRELSSWKPAEVQELFTALIAASIGTRPGHNFALEDGPLIRAMAQAVQPEVSEVWALDEAYMKTLSKSGQLRTATDLGLCKGSTGLPFKAEELGKKKTGDRIEIILHSKRSAAGAADYLPPLFHFASTDAEVRKNLKPKTPAAPTAAAKPKAAAKKAVKKPATKKATAKKTAARRKATSKPKVVASKANGKAAPAASPIEAIAAQKAAE